MAVAESRSLPAQIAALSRWTHHREQGLEQLAQARDKFEQRFKSETERKLYYARLSLAAKKARQRKAREGGGG